MILAVPFPIPSVTVWHPDPHLAGAWTALQAVLCLIFAALSFAFFYLVRNIRSSAQRNWRRFGLGLALLFALISADRLINIVSVWHSSASLSLCIGILLAIVSGSVAMPLLLRLRSMTNAANDYAERVSHIEATMAEMEVSLLAAQRLEDWSRMSAVVTHEISNPLESIQNILYLIRQSETATPELVRLSRTASDEADRILTISRSTLAFFRQSSTPERMDLRSAADSVRFLLEPVLRRRELVLDVQGFGDLTIHALSCELRQALLNLVRNACEATPRGGPHITLKLTGREDDIEITVSDHGAGIAPELLPTLFHFGRTTKGSDGNGVGLWTVKYIVEKHHGRIHVDSQPGLGTTFTILWPRHFEASPVGSRQRILPHAKSSNSLPMPASIS